MRRGKVCAAAHHITTYLGYKAIYHSALCNTAASARLGAAPTDDGADGADCMSDKFGSLPGLADNTGGRGEERPLYNVVSDITK